MLLTCLAMTSHYPKLYRIWQRHDEGRVWDNIKFIGFKPQVCKKAREKSAEMGSLFTRHQEEVENIGISTVYTYRYPPSSGNSLWLCGRKWFFWCFVWFSSLTGAVFYFQGTILPIISLWADKNLIVLRENRICLVKTMTWTISTQNPFRYGSEF